MKPVLEKVSFGYKQSFRTKLEKNSFINYPWHFHPEYEFVMVTEGCGRRFVGDNIEDFSVGDIVFMGAGLPHVWRTEQKNNGGTAEVIVVQFGKDAFGETFFDIPEMQLIKKLLNKSTLGLKIIGKTNTKAAYLLRNMILKTNSSSKQFIFLLELLELLSTSKDLKTLSSRSFRSIKPDKSGDRISNVFNYIAENFMQNITLEQIAKAANMNNTAFCRFFKEKTKKTFSTYLNEIRISYAKKLLIDGELSVSQIGYDCGYNSPSYFISSFKNISGKTPTQYRKEFS